MIAEESIHGRTQGRLLSWVLMLADATSPDHQALYARASMLAPVIARLANV